MDRADREGPKSRGRGVWLPWVLLLSLAVGGTYWAGVGLQTMRLASDSAAEARQLELLAAIGGVQSSVDGVRSVLKRDEKTLDFDLALTPMSGPGIRVMVDDSAAVQGVTLHDQDLLRLVNELRAAKAEGLAINGTRLTDTSAIRCAGPTIQVGGESIGPPYVIEAIGDPETLAAALRLPGGIVSELRNVDIRVKAETAEDIELPAAPFVAPRKGTVRPPENTG
jgi:uncharacterized protein YlxW (UPF0749 family)